MSLDPSVNPNIRPSNLFDSVNFPNILTQQASSQEEFYIKNNIIKPPENTDAINRITEKTLVIDSSSRNKREFPEPNKYTIELPNEYKDVISLQIINYCIPSPQYNIRNTNNIFYYSDVAPTIKNVANNRYEIAYSKVNLQKISLETGYYQSDLSVDNSGSYPLFRDELAVELEKKLTDSSNSTFTVTVLQRKDLYKITTDFGNGSNDPSDTRFFHFFPNGPNTYSGSTEVVDKETNQIVNTKQTPAVYNSVGYTMGFYREEVENMLRGMISMDSTGRVTGIGTSFTSELEVGDWIYVKTIDNNHTYRYRISSITSDSECNVTIDPSYSNGFGYAFAWVGRIVAPGVRNLLKDSYIIMKIGGSSILDSPTDAVNSSFCIVPTQYCKFEILDNLTTTKKYNPIVGRLQKLTISFLNSDGTPYDFKGLDHVLMFRLTRYVQNIGFANF